MKRAPTLLPVLFCAALALPACSKREPDAEPAVAAQSPAKEAPAPGAEAQSVRKIMRKATLSLEVRSVGAAHARAVAIAEERGGHVLTSSRVESRGDGAADEASSLVLRVPGDKLTGALVELRRLAAGSVSEQIGSEDVTDEFVDTESRLRNHKRLEEQLLELLKTATSIEGALKVHQELASVRGEIERLEGRRQFLERETTWATINLTLSELPVAAVSDGFVAASFARAKHDAVEVGQGIITAGIRLTGVLLPVLVLLGLPALASIWLLTRLLRRRHRVSTDSGL